MIVTIHYRARLSYPTTDPYNPYIHKQLCGVEHEIDTDTLQTVSFKYTPVQDPDDIEVPPSGMDDYGSLSE